MHTLYVSKVYTHTLINRHTFINTHTHTPSSPHTLTEEGDAPLFFNSEEVLAGADPAARQAMLDQLDDMLDEGDYAEDEVRVRCVCVREMCVCGACVCL